MFYPGGDTHDLKMWKSLRKDSEGCLEKLAAGAAGSQSFSALGHKFCVLSDARDIEQVFSNATLSTKAPLPLSLRWMVGDGTSLSDYGDEWNTWNQLRPLKRRSLGPHLSAFPEEVLIALWHQDIGALPLVVDAYELCYRTFFRTSWQELFKCSTDDAVKKAVANLRETSVAASLAASSRHYASYSDRYLSPPDTAGWPRRGKYGEQLVKRQFAFDFLLNRAEEVSEADSITADLRAWLGVQQLPHSESNGFLRFALTGTLLASFENSAAVATWLLWLLAGHPEWQERIVDGDERALGWCLNETLRLYPPVWSLVRQLSASASIGEHFIEAGTFIWMSPWVQGRQQLFWERADEFLPQRWENLTFPSGQFFPFGFGSRACPGESSARSQIAAWIRFLLRSYQISRVENAPPLPFFGVTQRPEAEVWLQFTRRSAVG